MKALEIIARMNNRVLEYDRLIDYAKNFVGEREAERVMSERQRLIDRIQQVTPLVSAEEMITVNQLG